MMFEILPLVTPTQSQTPAGRSPHKMKIKMPDQVIKFEYAQKIHKIGDRIWKCTNCGFTGTTLRSGTNDTDTKQQRNKESDKFDCPRCHDENITLTHHTPK